jgi:hypothetical protein
MFAQIAKIAKFAIKFVAVGFAATVIAVLFGADGATAADITFWAQMTWIALRQIPGRVWLALGEALAEMLPWIMLANIDL